MDIELFLPSSKQSSVAGIEIKGVFLESSQLHVRNTGYVKLLFSLSPILFAVALSVALALIALTARTALVKGVHFATLALLLPASLL